MGQVDIVVAVHNGEKFIKDCIRSLLKTDYPAKRIIIVNDGSTDCTEKMTREFDDKIILINKQHTGVADSRNAAIRNSTSEFIALTDADCQPDALWIKNAVEHFRDKETGAVTGWLHYKVTNTISAVREAEYAIRFARRKPKAYSVSCPVAIFRRSVLEEIGGFDLRFMVGGEDTEIGYRIREKGYKIVYEKDMVSFHAPEDKVSLYIKRNFRNGLNHLKVLKMREKRIFFGDDFFPFILRFQPVFTLGLLVSFPLLILTGKIFWLILSFICAILIIADFLPVTLYVCRTKGILGFISAFIILTLRNITWITALVTGIIKR